ncbi:MAG: ParB/RepB/Spo0J family partition protein [Oscillospiraceae bacterium]|nr:ParB/RepB/Spo0J family partition protein [Oscillospiraceae bacterium]
MAKNSAAGLLTSLDDLFSTQEEREVAAQPRVEDIPIDLIDDFPNHPFKVRMDGAMVRLVESVGQYGVLEPCLIRPKPDGRYEMVAGHRRKEACIMADRPSIRCIVQEMTDDQATIIMVDSNLHREEILPSEKAFAYKMKLDAMKRQGLRTDLTSATPLPKSERKTARQIIAEQTGESHEQIRKLIRLTYLIPKILEMVDNSVLKEKDKLQIALRPAVELSYLAEQEQYDLHETMLTEDRTPSHAQAIKMRKFSQDGRLNMDVIFSIMQEEKPNQKEQFKIPRERISKYFAPGTPVQKMEDTIIKALELYRKRQRDLQR